MVPAALPPPDLSSFRQYLTALDPRGDFTFSGYAQSLHDSGIEEQKYLDRFAVDSPDTLVENLDNMAEKLHIRANTTEKWEFDAFKAMMRRMAKGKGRESDWRWG